MGWLDIFAVVVLKVVRVTLELGREVLGEDGDVRHAGGVDLEKGLPDVSVKVQVVAVVRLRRDRPTRLNLRAGRVAEAVFRLVLKPM